MKTLNLLKDLLNEKCVRVQEENALCLWFMLSFKHMDLEHMELELAEKCINLENRGQRLKRNACFVDAAVVIGLFSV